MKIFVTGGAGYIGTSLVEKLNGLPEVKEIIVYDNMSHNNIRFFFGTSRLEKVRFVKGDILNHIELSRHLKDMDVVYHLAGVVKSPYSLEDSLKYEQVNQWGTANLVQNLENNPSIRKFIFLSSASVYGFSGVEIDLMEVNPMNAYGRSKKEAEKFVNLLAPEVDVEIIRAGNVFGYNRTVRLDSVINRFIFESLCYGRIQIFGNGQQIRPFIHIDSLTEDLAGALKPRKENTSVIRDVIQFHKSINDLRDILQTAIEDLEYIYVNQGFEAPHLNVTQKDFLSDEETSVLIKREIEVFKNQFVLIK